MRNLVVLASGQALDAARLTGRLCFFQAFKELHPRSTTEPSPSRSPSRPRPPFPSDWLPRQEYALSSPAIGSLPPNEEGSEPTAPSRTRAGEAGPIGAADVELAVIDIEPGYPSTEPGYPSTEP
eukprot:558850-Prorocentrum_minimum.AAC.1